MKIFTSNLSNFYLSLIMAISMMQYTFTLSAEEYKSMIRYDRVWECYCDGYGPGLTVKCMKFTGTEEINGKIYHKIETFRKTFPKIDYMADTLIYDNYVDGLHEHEGYLREENGVTYTLIIGTPLTDPNHQGESALIDYGHLYIPGKIEPEENEVIVEIPVYDFTKKQGESYDGQSFCMEVLDPCTFSVNREEYIEIGGVEYRKTYLLPEGMKENEYFYGEEIIDGIGATGHGCLNYHELVTRPTKIWAHNYFTRLLDLDGNVLYNPLPSPMFDISYGSFGTPDGVDRIAVSRDSTPCYDIVGRRIVAPAPGQLYIQGGRKHIAK